MNRHEFLAPLNIWRSFYGITFEYVASDAQLIDAGIVSEAELPGPRRGGFRESKFVKTSRLSDGRCRAKISGPRSARMDGGFQAFVSELTQVSPRDQGALAFRQTLLNLREINKECIKDSGDYDPRRFMPEFRNAVAASSNEAWTNGFWDAFGVWLAQTLDGCEIDLDCWDVLRDLEDEGEG